MPLPGCRPAGVFLQPYHTSTHGPGPGRILGLEACGRCLMDTVELCEDQTPQRNPLHERGK